MSADDEFDAMSNWTVDAIEELGADHAIPGACRGSGGPGALAWLAGWLLDGPGGPLLDLGGGLGGPSAWLRDHHGVAPVVTEPMTGAAHGARRLFGLSSVQADGSTLPFGTSTCGAGWCLGVLSTTPDIPGLLSETARVMRPAGHFGLVAYTATGTRPVDQPEGNHFPTRSELDGELAHAGFEIVGCSAIIDLPTTDPTWGERADAVDRLVRARNRADLQWQRAKTDEDHVARLLNDGLVTGVAIRARRR